MALELSAQQKAVLEPIMDTYGLFGFFVSDELELLAVSSEDSDVFFYALQVSGCLLEIQRHFSENDETIVIMDKLGLSWIACKDEIYRIFGPFLPSDVSEKGVRSACDDQEQRDQGLKELARKLNEVAIIPHAYSLCYAALIDGCIHGRKRKPEDIHFLATEFPHENNFYPKYSLYGIQELERLLLEAVRTGNINAALQIPAPSQDQPINQMSKDTIQQQRYFHVAAIVLMSRAAMEGGMSYEGAVRISDYYCQCIDRCQTSAQLYTCLGEAINAFIQRVRQCQQAAQSSHLARPVQEYIRTHVTERITLHDIAEHLGYSDYYLSLRYYKDTGEKVGQAIKREKIQHAAELIRSTEFSFVEISVMLSFSSQSYFIAVFRDIMGITPGEYKKQLFTGGKETFPEKTQ